jgi:hypothetical protein
MIEKENYYFCIEDSLCGDQQESAVKRILYLTELEDRLCVNRNVSGGFRPAFH